MADRKKVIKGLKLCEIGSGDKCYETECPYYEKECTEGLKNDILALLKEQVAKKVIESTNMYTGLPITHCPKCGVSIDRYLYGRQHEGQTNYCPYCGQEIKWDD